MSPIFYFDGLDATGKGTLLEMFKKDKIEVVSSPPEGMKSFRQDFDNGDLESRFLFYAVGNVWVDRNILQPAVESNKLVLVDRSFLTTLAAHDLRGVSEEFLKIGFDLAKTCIKPRISYIIHVDKDERRRRLLARGYCDKIDQQNMAFEDTMEPTYLKWAERLGWRTEIFDNTNLTIEEAYKKLFDLIVR